MEQKKWNRNDRRPPLRRAQEPSEAAENMLEGRNAVQEALAAGRPIDKLYIAAGETDRALARLAAMAKEAGAAVVETDRRKLDQLSATGAHQGVVAMVAAHAYATVDEILENAKSRGEAPLIVLCDDLSNLVSTIRDLQKAGVWVFGTAADGDTGLYAADLKGPAAIVIGNEGEGMSRLVSEACDFKVSIPMHGRISSLNASNAAAILLYEAVRQRG